MIQQPFKYQSESQLVFDSCVQSSAVHSGQKVNTVQALLTDAWTDKMCMHTVEYYSPFKRKYILTHAIIWMNTEHFRRRKINQI